MTSATGVNVPRDLVRGIFRSDRGGKLTLPPEQRPVADDWLCHALTDYLSLKEHVSFLQELYGKRFRMPSRRRDALDPSEYLSESNSTHFPHSQRLPEDRAANVIERGVEALQIDEVAELLLNPAGLADLFDIIDDLQPDHWLDVMHRVGGERLLSEQSNKVVNDPDGAVKGPVRWTAARRLTTPLAIGSAFALAACLLVGILVGRWSFSLAGSSPTLFASVDRTTADNRGGPGQFALKLSSQSPCFATIIVIREDGSLNLLPTISGDEIAIPAGGTVTTQPLPDGVLALTVITETPADGVLRRAIARQKFQPNQVGDLEILVRQALMQTNFHQSVVSRVRLDQK